MQKKERHPEPSSQGLVAHYKLWAGLTSTARVFDYTLNSFAGTTTGTDIHVSYPGFEFNGTDDFIDIGSGPSSVSTVALWIKPSSVAGTDSPLDLNGTDFLTIVTGTLTKNGFAGGTTALYTDGLVDATITTNWHLIAITDTSAKNASDFDIGKETANFFTGRIGEVRLYSTVLSPARIRSLFELTKWRYPNLI